MRVNDAARELFRQGNVHLWQKYVDIQSAYRMVLVNPKDCLECTGKKLIC